MRIRNEDPEKVKQQKRRYYLKHRHKILQKSKEYRQTHRQERNLYKNDWEKKNRDRANEIKRNYRLKNIYKISKEEYHLLCIKQRGTCAICKCPERTTINGKNKSLSVDHDHLSLKVRGLLCATCNKALGLFKDNANILSNAIEYLNSNENSQTPILDGV